MVHEDDRDDIARFFRFAAFTPLVNWTGQPAMSVPLHETPDGLPVGVQFMDRFGDEATLFRLAEQLDGAQPSGW
jgi:amidase